MSNEKYALSPAAVEAINNISGAYSAPFWDGILEVSVTLDTVRKIKSVLEALYSTGKIIEAYNQILAIYDVIAIETPASVIELEPYARICKKASCFGRPLRYRIVPAFRRFCTASCWICLGQRADRPEKQQERLKQQAMNHEWYHII